MTFKRKEANLAEVQAPVTRLVGAIRLFLREILQRGDLPEGLFGVEIL